ncbi:unnamed protein product [Effrenium voratum]|uniref:Uncharacterized protein n=1 Tax=Effrenium voratum TaxID=2562239 RepID=A0AA36J2Q3_9DINO|nr:unnamed protein product [Effrenium voratum]CAJ1426036.1 unnamed protein product [Effrenium voratum]
MTESTARLVVKNSFLELVEECQRVSCRVQGGTRSESDLPDLRVSQELNGLTDDDTDIESCADSPDYFLEDSDTEVSSEGLSKRRSWSDLQERKKPGSLSATQAARQLTAARGKEAKHRGTFL